MSQTSTGSAWARIAGGMVAGAGVGFIGGPIGSLLGALAGGMVGAGFAPSRAAGAVVLPPATPTGDGAPDPIDVMRGVNESPLPSSPPAYVPINTNPDVPVSPVGPSRPLITRPPSFESNEPGQVMVDPNLNAQSRDLVNNLLKRRTLVQLDPTDLLFRWLQYNAEQHVAWMNGERQLYLDEINRRSLPLPSPIDTSWWPQTPADRARLAVEAVGLARKATTDLQSDWVRNEVKQPVGWVTSRRIYVGEFARRGLSVPSVIPPPGIGLSDGGPSVPPPEHIVLPPNPHVPIVKGPPPVQWSIPAPTTMSQQPGVDPVVGGATLGQSPGVSTASPVVISQAQANGQMGGGAPIRIGGVSIGRREAPKSTSGSTRKISGLPVR